MARALVATAVALAVSCGAERPGDGQEIGTISFETLLRASQSGVDQPLRQVVRDERTWAELWDAIHRDVSPRPPLPSTDFSREMLIVVAAGTRSSGGFGIGVQGVALRGDTLEVQVLETCPEPGDMVAGVLTQPVEVVRVERLPQSPGFLDTQSPSCSSA